MIYRFSSLFSSAKICRVFPFICGVIDLFLRHPWIYNPKLSVTFPSKPDVSVKQALGFHHILLGSNKNCCWDANTWAVQKRMPGEQRGGSHSLHSLTQQTQRLSPLHNVCSAAKPRNFGDANTSKNCMSGDSTERLSISSTVQTLWSKLLCHGYGSGSSHFLCFQIA